MRSPDGLGVGLIVCESSRPCTTRGDVAQVEGVVRLGGRRQQVRRSTRCRVEWSPRRRRRDACAPLGMAALEAPVDDGLEDARERRVVERREGDQC